MRLMLTILLHLTASTLFADSLKCDLTQYKTTPGLTATVDQDMLVVTWTGDGGAELRARYTIERAQPVVRDLAIRRSGGPWATLGQNLTPEFHVTSGVRRVSEQQLQPLRGLGVQITPQVIDREKWYVFWDAPLLIPGVREGQNPRNIGLPRKPEEIRRATSSFATTACSVKTDGLRLELTFPGLSMGIFSGNLRFTVYRGTNLIRLEAIAKTEEPSVAYKYQAGLKGFSTDLTTRAVWRDVGGSPQQHQFGGARNDTPVPVRARNRILIAEGKGGSVAAFPPPITFFFTREVETNLGYVWYRKDADTKFSLGVRQGDGEDVPQYVENFALYNAPPGTWQRMAVYFYASPEAAEPTRHSVLAFTHGDTYKPLPGYKTMVNHFHISFTDRLRASGSLDTQTADLVALKALGIDIVGLSDFHADRLRANDPGPGRFQDQKDYYEGSRRASDKGFLVAPWEEPNAHFGGHYNILFPRPVYWTKIRAEGKAFTENVPTYGKVYHTASPADVTRMLEAEGGYWFHAHPRTKGTTGYPDAIKDKEWVKNDRYLGVAFKPGMGADLSEQRMCEYRGFDTIDMMNNLYANSGLLPKYLIADCDTYQKNPADDIYPNVPMNYLKLGRVPGPDEDWGPILKALRNGDFFVTTGQILIKNYAVEGTGNRRTVAAELEWTFPLEFLEVVWGDGVKVDRQIIPARDLMPFGNKRFAIPFDAAGKSWVRFAAWDSAGNGAFVQPIWLKPPTSR